MPEPLTDQEVYQTIQRVEEGKVSVYEALAKLKVRAQESMEIAENKLDEEPFECPI